PTGPKIRADGREERGRAWCDYIPVTRPGPYIHVRAFARIDCTLSAVDKAPSSPLGAAGDVHDQALARHQCIALAETVPIEQLRDRYAEAARDVVKRVTTTHRVSHGFTAHRLAHGGEHCGGAGWTARARATPAQAQLLACREDIVGPHAIDARQRV